jgi:hypothetical protein
VPCGKQGILNAGQLISIQCHSPGRIAPLVRGIRREQSCCCAFFRSHHGVSYKVKVLQLQVNARGGQRRQKGCWAEGYA